MGLIHLIVKSGDFIVFVGQECIFWLVLLQKPWSWSRSAYSTGFVSAEIVFLGDYSIVVWNFHFLLLFEILFLDVLITHADWWILEVLRWRVFFIFFRIFVKSLHKLIIDSWISTSLIANIRHRFSQKIILLTFIRFLLRSIRLVRTLSLTFLSSNSLKHFHWSCKIICTKGSLITDVISETHLVIMCVKATGLDASLVGGSYSLICSSAFEIHGVLQLKLLALHKGIVIDWLLFRLNGWWSGEDFLSLFETLAEHGLLLLWKPLILLLLIILLQQHKDIGQISIIHVGLTLIHLSLIILILLLQIILLVKMIWINSCRLNMLILLILIPILVIAVVRHISIIIAILERHILLFYIKLFFSKII